VFYIRVMKIITATFIRSIKSVYRTLYRICIINKIWNLMKLYTYKNSSNVRSEGNCIGEKYEVSLQTCLWFHIQEIDGRKH